MPKRATAIRLSEQEQEALMQLTRRHRSEQQVVLRARIILAAGQGSSNIQIARELDINVDTVRLWRDRWASGREIEQEKSEQEAGSVVQRLQDAPRPGAIPKFTVEQRAQMAVLACEAPAKTGRPISQWWMDGWRYRRQNCERAIESRRLSYLVEAAHQRHQDDREFLVTRRFSRLIELLVVDEANRLKDGSLEQIRDIADRGKLGLVLLGMPGLEKRIARVPQLYSRVGFNHEMEPLSQEETSFFLDQRWQHRVKAYSNDFTDQEAIATILRITKGNIRLIERLMMQVELVLVANQLTIVTKEVVETARKNLIIGPD